MSIRKSPRRSPARYLAPVALLATIVGTYLVVHHALGSPQRPSTPPIHATRRTQARARTVTTTQSKPTGAPRYYVVQSGDSLYAISIRTHVPLATIEALNPQVSARSLHVGQRIKLHR